MPTHPLRVIINSLDIAFTPLSQNPQHRLSFRDRSNMIGITVSSTHVHLLPRLVKLRDIPPAMVTSLSHLGETIYTTNPPSTITPDE